MLKKSIYVLFALLFFAACETKSPQEKIENLNGYWMIAKVEKTNGEIKKFGLSPMVDYIEIEHRKGFRKKVNPRFDGTFLVTNAEEKITVKVEHDSINLYYSTGMDQWMETLISSEENQISFKNEDGKIYTYRRFTGYLEKKHGKEKQ